MNVRFEDPPLDFKEACQALVSASYIAREFGQTASYWIKQAKNGMIPGAYKSAGRVEKWQFDLGQFEEWYDLAHKEIFRKLQTEFGLVNFSYVKNINKKHWLYIITSTPYVKIGISADVEKRLKIFRDNSPHAVDIAFKAKVPFSQASWIEAGIHEDLREVRHKGEWFICSVEEALTTMRKWRKLGLDRQQRFCHYLAERERVEDAR